MRDIIKRNRTATAMSEAAGSASNILPPGARAASGSTGGTNAAMQMRQTEKEANFARLHEHWRAAKEAENRACLVELRSQHQDWLQLTGRGVKQRVSSLVNSPIR